MEESRSKHTISIHTPFRALGTLGEADGPAAPAAEAGRAELAGAIGVWGHHRDAASCGHGARGNLAPGGGAAREAPAGDSAAGAADTYRGREGAQGGWPALISPTL